MRRKCEREKEGFVLLSIMVVAVILGILGAGVMKHAENIAAFAFRYRAAVQAEWDAQSGLEYAVSQILDETKTDANRFDDFDAQFSSRGSTVVKMEHVGDADSDSYLVESQIYDKSSGVTRGCKQVYEVNREQIAGSMPMMVLGSDTNATVDVMVAGNNMTISITTDDEIYILGSMNVGSFANLDADINLTADLTGGVTEHENINTNDFDVPQVEIVEAIKKMMVEFDEDVEDVEDFGTKVDVDDLMGGLELNGQTFYVDGDLVITEDMEISGDSGKLIVLGDVLLEGGNKSALEINGIEMYVEGDVIDKNKMSITGDPDILYVAGTMEFKNKGEISLSGGVVVGGDIVAKNSTTFDHGFVYVDGTLEVNNNLTIIEGLLMAGVLDVFNNAELSFSPDAIPAWLATLLASLDNMTVPGDPESMNRVAWAPHGDNVLWGGRTDAVNTDIDLDELEGGSEDSYVDPVITPGLEVDPVGGGLDPDGGGLDPDGGGLDPIGGGGLEPIGGGGLEPIGGGGLIIGLPGDVSGGGLTL